MLIQRCYVESTLIHVDTKLCGMYTTRINIESVLIQRCYVESTLIQVDAMLDGM